MLANTSYTIDPATVFEGRVNVYFSTSVQPPHSPNPAPLSLSLWACVDRIDHIKLQRTQMKSIGCTVAPCHHTLQYSQSNKAHSHMFPPPVLKTRLAISCLANDPVQPFQPTRTLLVPPKKCSCWRNTRARTAWWSCCSCTRRRTRPTEACWRPPRSSTSTCCSPSETCESWPCFVGSRSR